MTSTSPIRLLIVDDHDIVREGLVAMLAGKPGIEIVAQAADGYEAVELAARVTPDVILMDVKMPKMDGVEAARRIVAENPKARILMLSSFTNDALIVESIQVGAQGYILKNDSVDELVTAIRQIHNGAVPSNTIVAQTLMRRLQQTEEKEKSAPDHKNLTERELEVISLLAGGGSNASIARELNISERTVGTHISNAIRKLGLSNRTQLVLYALRNGLATLGPKDDDED